MHTRKLVVTFSSGCWCSLAAISSPLSNYFYQRPPQSGWMDGAFSVSGDAFFPWFSRHIVFCSMSKKMPTTFQIAFSPSDLMKWNEHKFDRSQTFHSMFPVPFHRTPQRNKILDGAPSLTKKMLGGVFVKTFRICKTFFGYIAIMYSITNEYFM